MCSVMGKGGWACGWTPLCLPFYEQSKRVQPLSQASPALSEFYVYAHRRSDCGAIFYVGKGRGGRFASPHGRNSYWGRVAKKYGFDAIILKDGMDERAAFDLEAKTIAFYRSIGVQLTNLTDGGEGPSGRSFSDEAKAKMRAAKVGRKLPPDHIAKIAQANAGKKRSEEYREFMRGRVFTEAHRANLSKGATGRKLAPETIEKIKETKRLNPKPWSDGRRLKASARHSGAGNANYNPKLYTFFHPDHGEITCTQNELRKRYGIHHSNLSHMVSGRKQRVQGWALKKEDER